MKYESLRMRGEVIDEPQLNLVWRLHLNLGSLVLPRVAGSPMG